MLQLQQKQKTKDGKGVKHEDHFLCTITCGHCGKRQHYADECHIKRRESEKPKKAEKERCNNAGKDKPERGGHNPGRSPSKGSPLGGQRSSAPQMVEEEHPATHPRVSSRLSSVLSPPTPALVVPRKTRPPGKASSTGTLSACRLLGCM